MKKLKKINICGVDYDIEYVEDRMTKHGVGTSASESTWATKIWVDTTQSEESMGYSLIHEVVEAINSLNNMELNHQQISTLGVSLYGVFKQLEKQ